MRQLAHLVLPEHPRFRVSKRGRPRTVNYYKTKPRYVYVEPPDTPEIAERVARCLTGVCEHANVYAVAESERAHHPSEPPPASRSWAPRFRVSRIPWMVTLSDIDLHARHAVGYDYGVYFTPQETLSGDHNDNFGSHDRGTDNLRWSVRGPWLVNRLRAGWEIITACERDN